jgi:dynactin complex subunit
MGSLSEPSSTSATFPLGSRLCVGGQRCTVLFAGLLSGTTPADAPWLGVEWDDPTRGKHDGSHGGVRYFRCLCVHALSLDVDEAF